jgi:hypothetical protein
VSIGKLNLGCFSGKTSTPNFQKMNKKTRIKNGITAALMLLMFPIYRLWHGFGMNKVNYWLQEGFYHPVEEYWYFKFLAEHIGCIVFTIVIIRLARMRPWIELIAIAWLMYRIWDLAMFFYNFNRSSDYVVAYSFAGLATLLVYGYRELIAALRGRHQYLKSKIEAKEVYQ